LLSPTCDAVTVQSPPAFKVTTAPLTEQAPAAL